jgi:hypothetical protein
MLRCLVDPLRAGENIRKRLVKKGTAIKVPLMTGIGERMCRSWSAGMLLL